MGMKKSWSQKSKSPSQLTDRRENEGARQLARQDAVEEWKWRGVPVWSHDELTSLLPNTHEVSNG
jgi:hypothetical protein